MTPNNDIEELIYDAEPGDWIAIKTVPSPFVPEPTTVAYARKVEDGRWKVNFRLDSITGTELAYEIQIAYLWAELVQ